MPCFPLFFHLESRKIVIAGGGHAALDKCRRLLSFHPDLLVVSPEFLDGFSQLPGVTCIRDHWKDVYSQDAFLVIAATDDHQLNHEISRAMESQKILCNVVDDPDWCSALFGAVVAEEELSIGISTNGASPAAAKYLKARIGESIPDWFDESLHWLKTKRPMILKSVPAKKRSALFTALFQACMDNEGPLSDEQMRRILNAYE